MQYYFGVICIRYLFIIQKYFLIDTNTKIWTEIIDLVVLGRNYWSSCKVWQLIWIVEPLYELGYGWMTLSLPWSLPTHNGLEKVDDYGDYSSFSFLCPSKPERPCTAPIRTICSIFECPKLITLSLLVFINVGNVKACWRGQKLFQPLTPSTCFNIHSIWWYGWKVLSHRFLKLFSDWKLVEYQMSKNVMSPYSIFWRGQRPLYIEYTFNPFNMSKMSNITLYTVLCKSGKHHFRPFWHEQHE